MRKLPILLIFALALGAFAQDSVNTKIPNVAVLDVEGSLNTFSREDLAAITARFETELAKTNQVRLLERRNMDLILQEQGFQQSGACNSAECQVQMGQLLGVDRIITGSISKMKNLYTLNLKMVDVENGQNLRSYALDIRGGLDVVLRGGCYEMAQVFAGLKQPKEGHQVLSEERRIWPWVLGSSLAIGGLAVAVLVLLQDDGKPSDNTVNADIQ